MTFILNCSICLDKLNDPVATPCGHLSCDACIKTHARRSHDAYKSTCPTCRAPFSIVTPDLSIVPKKYHNFVSPPLRRVFLDAREDDSRSVIKNLNDEVAAIKECAALLQRDNKRLADCCDEVQCALGRESYWARNNALEGEQKLNRLMAEYHAHKFPASLHPNHWATMKRMSGLLKSSSRNSTPP